MTSDQPITREVGEVIDYLCKEIKEAGIETLNLQQDISNFELQDQIQRLEHVHVDKPPKPKTNHPTHNFLGDIMSLSIYSVVNLYIYSYTIWVTVEPHLSRAHLFRVFIYLDTFLTPNHFSNKVIDFSEYAVIWTAILAVHVHESQEVQELRQSPERDIVFQDFTLVYPNGLTTSS